MASIRKKNVLEDIPAHDHDHDAHYEDRSDETEDAMDESKGPLEESGATITDESDEEIEASVQQDILRFEQSFKDITRRYRLINRIGEGPSSHHPIRPSFYPVTRHTPNSY